MSHFHAYCSFSNPRLHIWREGADTTLNLSPLSAVAVDGWFEFAYDFEPGITEAVHFALFNFEEGKPDTYENAAHNRKLPRLADGAFVSDVWFVQGAERVLTADPLASAAANVRVHVISQSRLRPSELYLWDAATGSSRRVNQAGENAEGPYFDLTLQGVERFCFNFKFVARNQDGGFTEFEPDFANRLWVAQDGAEVWTHSFATAVVRSLPQKRTLRVRFKQESSSLAGVRMHYWQTKSDFSDDAAGVVEPGGWTRHEVELFTGLQYGIQFLDMSLPEQRRWEDAEAVRSISIDADEERWTLEGDKAWFKSQPQANRQIELVESLRPPSCSVHGALFAHVWINRARFPLQTAVAASPTGTFSFATYPEIVTSVRLYDAGGVWEKAERHTLQVPAAGGGSTRRYLVVDRPVLLESAPPANLFQDPPFSIRRPGAYETEGSLHFVFHAPRASRVRLIGKFTNWLNQPVEMFSTVDETYWWARVPRAQVIAGLTGGTDTYHGAKYQFLLNDSERSQDPAAGWVESSWNQAASRLVQSDAFVWNDQTWQRPSWDYLTIYQLHPSRFTNRFQDLSPLRRIAREIDTQAGYLRDLGITAILLLPVNEVGSQNSWGYDPAFFYAIEGDYGGPDALKELVDTCHRHGLAILIDVVFNHAGSTDNILWSISQSSYFDGDTKWGALINFDHPQCRHFFAQNLVYLAQEYHIDGFRFDHTATIIHSAAWDDWSGFVTVRGSGGGWEFLHSIRSALREAVGERCLLMAEHLPNEWSVTNYGGPMDTQWCDAFHDRMVDACRRQFGMSRLADAFKLSHTACDNWYKVTNYPESHDEVGNVRDRIAYVAGWGQGFRMSKVAAAGTLLSRGIPMYFMGAEAAEDQQFAFGQTTQLDLTRYQVDPERGRLRLWWKSLAELRQNSSIKGPAPLVVTFAGEQVLAFARGERGDYFVVLNFGGWSGYLDLAELNLPDGTYRELWNSTWPAFAIQMENEDEHTNGGRDTRINRGWRLHVPDYGAVILERVD